MMKSSKKKKERVNPVFKAIDDFGKVVTIENAERGTRYRCPFCHGEMVVRKGNIRVHHFAHKEKLCDDWYSENKGPWHRHMQELFRKEYQEVVLWKDGDKGSGVFHIADICIPRRDGTNLIIEFQHSPMAHEEFFERSVFYSRDCRPKDQTGLNQIVWVFDYLDKQMFFTDAGKNPLETLDVDYVKAVWKRPSQTLVGYGVNDDFYRKHYDIMVVFHVSLRNWVESLRVNEGYDRDAEYHYSERYVKEFVGDAVDSFFVRPKYDFSDWKYFGGPVTREEVFEDWAKRQ